MTLRAKILAVFGGMLLGMIAVFYASSRLILLGSFARIEEERLIRNLDRVRDSLSAEVEQLDFITRDWAWWDETCAYIGRRNEAFAKENLNDVTLSALKIDAIVFLDASGRTVYATGFDRAGGVKAPLPEGLAARLAPGSPLTAYRGRRDRAAGIVMLPSGPVLLASRPILTGEGRGPIRGALVMVRSIDPGRVRALSALTHVALSIEPFRSDRLSGEFRFARVALAGSPADLIRPLNAGVIAGYRLLHDISGAPALILRVEDPRDIHTRGLHTLRYLVLSMLAVGLVCSAVFVIVLERLILSPLGRLTTRVDAIGTTGDLSSRVILGGRDELSRLAGSINGMLVALERAQEVLKRSEEDYRALFDNMLTGFAYHRIVTDEKGEAVDFIFIEMNSVFEKLTRLARGAILGKKASEVMPGIMRDEFDWIGMYGRVALTGATARVERYSEYLGRWYALSAYSPRRGYFAILFDDITERKRADERLYTLGTAVSQSIDGIAVVDPSGAISFANSSWAEMYGYPPGELPGKPLSAFSPPGQPAQEMELFRERIERDGAHQEEARQARKDGSVFHVWMSGTLLRDDAGKTVGSMMIVRDITQQKLVEQALRKTQRQQKAILDNIPDFAWLKDKESRFIAVNEPFARAGGERPENLVGKTDFDIWPRDLAERYRRDDAEVMASGRRICVEEPLVDAAGVSTWIETIKTPIYDYEGRVIGTTGIARDITERKRTEDEVRRLKQQIEFILGVTKTGLDIIDADHIIRYIDPEWQKAYGEPAGRKCYDYFMKRGEPCPGCAIHKALESRTTVVSEETLVREGNRTVQVTSMPFLDERGEWLVAEVNVDITERKRAEKRMEHLTRVLRAIRGADQLITREKDRAKLIAGACESLVMHRGYINAWVVLLGDAGEVRETAESGIGRDFAELVERMRRGELPDCGRRALEGPEPVIVVDPASACPECRFAAGYHRKGAMTVRLGYGGRVYGLLSVALPADFAADEEECALFGELARDIAFALHGLEIEEGRSRAEESLRMVARDLKRSNQELEQFAYVASHDLQEPLRMVSSYLQLLERRYSGRLDADATEFIRYAVEGAGQMKRLISDLLEYSRLGTSDRPFAPTDCEEVLERAMANLTVAIAESGAVVTHDPLPTVRADEQEFVQLFQNLLGNALKFRSAPPPRVHLSAARRGEDWLFSVRDNGIGIEPRFAERIFVIFQRLHGRDEYPGTGIGLALCRKIVERHGGRIWVESQAGGGAVFFFTIPGDREAMGGGARGGV